MKKILLLVSLLVCTMPVRAQMQIETISLQSRPATEVIEILRPMVQPGGSITGTGYKLIIKSTPENIEQIKSLLADIDNPPLQLLISVSMDKQTISTDRQRSQRVVVQGDKGHVTVGESDKQTGGGQVQYDSGRIKYDARLFEQRNRQDAPAVQQVRVTEGLWANIGSGQAIPITTRQRNADGTVTETTTYENVTTGFQVMPRVNGDMVSLSIRPQQQSVSSQGGGVYNTTGMETTVTGKLNEWIKLGGVMNQANTSQRGLTYSTHVRDADLSLMWVKVEKAR